MDLCLIGLTSTKSLTASPSMSGMSAEAISTLPPLVVPIAFMRLSSRSPPGFTSSTLSPNPESASFSSSGPDTTTLETLPLSSIPLTT